MPEQQSTELFPIKPIKIGAFIGGVNTAVGATEIEDDETVEIFNFEYDDANNLITRNGVSNSGATNYNDKITSIFKFTNDAGFVGILYTTADDLLSRTLAGSVTDIGSLLTLPNGARWRFAVLNGVCVGVNGANAGANPVQIVGPAPGTATALSAAPRGKFIALWHNRLWIARSDNVNEVQCSDIGTATVWNTDGWANPSHGARFDIDKNDGDRITALYPTKERLFIFKSKKIYVARRIEGTTLPITDVRSLEIVPYGQEVSTGIGCIADTTIKPVFDDTLFLSRYGVASLSAAELAADFESAIVSQKVGELSFIDQDVPESDFASLLVGDRSQYWLSVAAGSSPTGVNKVYVLDYKQIKKGILRWFFNDGYAFGTAYELYDENVSRLEYLIGCHNTTANNFFIGRYVPKQTIKSFSDAGNAIRQVLITKAYNHDLDDIRKYLMDWYLGIILHSDNLNFTVSYSIDEGLAEIPIPFGLAKAAATGGLYGTGLYGTALYGAVPIPATRRIRKKANWDILRKYVTIQYKISCNTVNQGFAINNFGIKAGELSGFRAANV